MFVEIDNTDMNIYNVDEWINNTRKANGGVISPEFAMEILSKTNNFTHIKKVLKCIKDNSDTAENIATYREFMLSCVDKREMSGEALKMLQDMSKLCGCSEELETINEKPKIYNKMDCKQIVVKSMDEFNELKGDNLSVVVDVVDGCKDWPRSSVFTSENVVSFFKCDFKNIDKLKIKGNVDVADFCQAKNLHGFLDLSECSKVDFTFCDLGCVDDINFKDKSEVNFMCDPDEIEEDEEFFLPRNLDVSMCSNVCFEGRDFSSVENFDYNKEEGVFDFKGATNVPEKLKKHNADFVAKEVMKAFYSKGNGE